MRTIFAAVTAACVVFAAIRLFPFLGWALLACIGVFCLVFVLATPVLLLQWVMFASADAVAYAWDAWHRGRKSIAANADLASRDV